MLASLLLPACVTRTLTIASEPPGAVVVLDGMTVGTTPYSETFLSYGVRSLELRLAGHERLVTEIDVWRPWWQFFPIDLFADLLWPFPIHDQRQFDFELEPVSPDPAGWEAAREVYEKLREARQRAAAPSATEDP